MTNTVIAPATAAATYEFYVGHGYPVTVCASGLGEAETIPVKKYLGASPVDVGLSLTDADPMVEISGVGRYQIDKPITAGNVGVYLDGGLGSEYDGMGVDGSPVLGRRG